MKSYWGRKELGGYAGLHHTAKKIAKFIPKVGIYVEPFAGLARLHDLVKADKYVYNDKSEYAYNYLVEKFKGDDNVSVFNMDFEKMFNIDTEDTFFLIDPPWRYQVYHYNDKPFIDRKPYDYYKTIFEICDTLKGNWIVCGTADERQTRGIMKDKPNKIIVESDEGVIFGKKARTLLIGSKPFAQ